MAEDIAGWGNGFNGGGKGRLRFIVNGALASKVSNAARPMDVLSWVALSKQKSLTGDGRDLWDKFHECSYMFIRS